MIIKPLISVRKMVHEFVFRLGLIEELVLDDTQYVVLFGASVVGLVSRSLVQMLSKVASKVRIELGG